MKSLSYYRAAYIGALSIVAVLAVASHFVIHHIVTRQDRTASITDMSGRQRMLSQRIASLSLEYATEGDGEKRVQTKALIEEAVDLMGRSHLALTQGDPEMGIPKNVVEETDPIFYKEPYLLDQRVRTFLSDAKGLLALEWTPDIVNDRHLWAIREKARDKFLEALNAWVTQYVETAHGYVESLRWALGIMLTTILATLIVIAVFVFRPLFKGLIRQREELYDLARTDPLTGSFNRRSFFELAEREFTRTNRYGAPLSALMLDIDRFKQVNDTHGHAVGDEVIKAMVSICLEGLREADLFGRLGGEEFAAVLPETTKADAVKVAEKLRTGIAELAISCGKQSLSFTVSIGVCQTIPDDNDILDTLNRADTCLYEAKAAGRNRVCA